MKKLLCIFLLIMPTLAVWAADEKNPEDFSGEVEPSSCWEFHDLVHSRETTTEKRDKERLNGTENKIKKTETVDRTVIRFNRCTGESWKLVEGRWERMGHD